MDMEVISKYVRVPNENRWMVISLPRLKCLEEVYKKYETNFPPFAAIEPSKKMIACRGPDGLTDNERLAIGMHKNGLTSRQIAEAMSVSQDRARKLVSNARKAILRKENNK